MPTNLSTKTALRAIGALEKFFDQANAIKPDGKISAYEINKELSAEGADAKKTQAVKDVAKVTRAIFDKASPAFEAYDAVLGAMKQLVQSADGNGSGVLGPSEQSTLGAPFTALFDYAHSLTSQARASQSPAPTPAPAPAPGPATPPPASGDQAWAKDAVAAVDAGSFGAKYNLDQAPAIIKQLWQQSGNRPVMITVDGQTGYVFRSFEEGRVVSRAFKADGTEIPVQNPPPQPPLSQIPAFAANGPTDSALVGGEDATRYPVNPVLTQAAASLSDANWVFSAHRYKLDPAKLQAMLADPQRKDVFATSLVFLGTNAGGGSTLEAAPNAKADADLYAGTFGERTDLPAASQEEAWQHVQELGKSLTQDPSFALYKLGWSNQDDSSAQGFVGINAQTGEVRAVIAYSPP